MKIIILAGGLGTRLWPFPPKQFSHFGEEFSLLQKTLLRFLKSYIAKDLVIVTQASFLDLAKTQAREIGFDLEDRVIAEPEGKNTTAAILFALQWLKEQQEEIESFLISPSDHIISPEEIFLERLSFAEKNAGNHHILFGVFPTTPNTGFGYIETDFKTPLSNVLRFIEKPPLVLAEKLLLKGNCLWHAGICLFRTKLFLEELEIHQPEMMKAYRLKHFHELPHLSIDHAFLEYSKNLKVLPLSVSWSDVGSWDGVYEAFEKDTEGNVKMGDVIGINTKNSFIFSEKKRVATIDVQDLLIIDTEEGLLIVKKGSSQKVGLLKQIQQSFSNT